MEKTNANITDYNKMIDVKYLYTTYINAIKNENIILLYEVIYYLTILSNMNEFDIFLDFLKISENEKDYFYNLSSFSDYNPYLTKILMNLIYNYTKFFKSNKVNLLFK